MNIILEGPDGSGKSSLLTWLSSKLGRPATVHHGPYKGLDSEALCWAYHRQLEQDPAIKLHDRSWLSEPIYGSVYRPDEPVRVDSVQRRALERQAGKAIVVLCLPEFERCRINFNARRAEELLKDEHQLLQVYTRYTSLARQTSLPVLQYDYTNDPPETLLYRLLRYQQTALRRRVIIVGEQANIRPSEPVGYRAPFTAYNKQGCSYWLNKQLDDAGIPEDALFWVNARTEVGHTMSAQEVIRHATNEFSTIALGLVAEVWCRTNNLGPTHTLSHPQHHKRFKHDKPYPLITLLKELLNDS